MPPQPEQIVAGLCCEGWELLAAPMNRCVLLYATAGRRAATAPRRPPNGWWGRGLSRWEQAGAPIRCENTGIKKVNRALFIYHIKIKHPSDLLIKELMLMSNFLSQT